MNIVQIKTAHILFEHLWFGYPQPLTHNGRRVTGINLKEGSRDIEDIDEVCVFPERFDLTLITVWITYDDLDEVDADKVEWHLITLDELEALEGLRQSLK